MEVDEWHVDCSGQVGGVALSLIFSWIRSRLARDAEVCDLNRLRVARLSAATVTLMLPVFAYGVSFIAGVEPYQRPAGAPVITTVDHDHDWYMRALHGIASPYPASLRFLEDQGNWYTPFDHPGATGRYDIRNWHRK